jgi:small subunit ribosomal protein S9
LAEQHYYYGTGRRKTSIARVRLYPGDGSITVNGKPVDEAFPWPAWRINITEPLQLTGSEEKFNVIAKVTGGGIVSQSGALRHGISRALLVADESLKSTLRKNGLLTRDAREKERKKYGLKRARKAKQYTKR